MLNKRDYYITLRPSQSVVPATCDFIKWEANLNYCNPLQETLTQRSLGKCECFQISSKHPWECYIPYSQTCQTKVILSPPETEPSLDFLKIKPKTRPKSPVPMEPQLGEESLQVIEEAPANIPENSAPSTENEPLKSEPTQEPNQDQNEIPPQEGASLQPPEANQP